MQSGFYSATGGMVTQINRLDIISNNLANINTSGFKKDGNVIGTFQRLYQEQRDILPLSNHTKEGAMFLNRAITKVPQIVDDYTNFENGAIIQTGNKLDMALKEKNAFFVIKTDHGVFLTKNGSFSLDAQNNLTTKDGNLVLGSNYFNDQKPIQIAETSRLHIDKDGMIFINNQPINQIMIASVKDMRDLEKVGNNFYKMKKDIPFDQIDSTDMVDVGFLEKSNVNAVMQMIGLIDANRMVGMYQKVMDSQMNDLNSDAINKLASTKG